MNNNLLVLGAGGHGRDVMDIALLSRKWDKISYLDDKPVSDKLTGIHTIGKLRDFKLFTDEFSYGFVAIGNNALRLQLINEVLEAGFKMPTLIHPTAIISNTVEIECGSVVLAGAIINTCNKISRGCIVNIGSTLGHDCNLSEGVQVSPGANIGGCTSIGERSWICIGANVTNNISIPADTIIGAGAVVVKDITESGTYIGVPVRRVD